MTSIRFAFLAAVLASITDDTGCGKRCNLSVMVLGDPANTVLQLSMRDVMKACMRVFADSASSDS